jgi:MraZ protein
MFLGTYEHSLDAKGRLVMPRKFRDLLEDGCVITKGQEHCLSVWPPDAWKQEYERVNNLPATNRKARMYRRAFFAGADKVSLDKQGRVPVPEKLRVWAEMDKDVTVVGSGDVIEVWATSVWDAEEAKADDFFSGVEEVLGLGGEEI